MAESRICSVEGCGNRHSAKGLCKFHYDRAYYHGDALGGGPRRTSRRGDALKWLLAHMDTPDGTCLIWPFSDDGHGYGQINYKGHVTKAHRVMCRLVYGEPPTNRHEAAHSCGNGSGGCVHPKHLRWATPEENASDKIAHGTTNRGLRSARVRLSEEQVRAIREMRGRNQKEIAALFGVSRTTVSSILDGSNWAWLK